MNERILQIRKYYNYSQEKFGKLIGMTGAGISKIESGDRGVTEQTILIICEKLHVSENWLRTGKGEMFISFAKEEEAAYLVGKFSKNASPFKIKFLNFILSQPDENWDALEKMIDDFNEFYKEKK